MKQVKIIVLLLVCAAITLSQGMHWTSTSEGVGGKQTQESFALSKRMKIVQTGGDRGGTVMIVRLDKELIWMINPEKKTYSEITFDELQQMVEKGKERMAAMKARMKEMPEEQRKMMEKMTGGMDEPIDVKKSDETKKIAGHECTKLTAFRGGEPFMTMWIAKDVKEFKSLMADWKESSERLSSIGSSFMKGIGDIYKNIEGFPMETSLSMMGHNLTTTVTSIEVKWMPPSVFEIPDGYSKVDSPMKGAMQRMDQK